MIYICKDIKKRKINMEFINVRIDKHIPRFSPPSLLLFLEILMKTLTTLKISLRQFIFISRIHWVNIALL